MLVLLQKGGIRRTTVEAILIGRLATDVEILVFFGATKATVARRPVSWLILGHYVGSKTS